MGTSVVLVKEINTSDLQGQKIMIDFESGKYFLLKGAANDIWDCLSLNNAVKIEDIINMILTKYSVSKEECIDSVNKFLVSLNDLGFITYID